MCIFHRSRISCIHRKHSPPLLCIYIYIFDCLYVCLVYKYKQVVRKGAQNKNTPFRCRTIRHFQFKHLMCSSLQSCFYIQPHFNVQQANEETKSTTATFKQIQQLTSRKHAKLFTFVYDVECVNICACTSLFYGFLFEIILTRIFILIFLLFVCFFCLSIVFLIRIILRLWKIQSKLRCLEFFFYCEHSACYI